MTLTIPLSLGKFSWEGSPKAPPRVRRSANPPLSAESLTDYFSKFGPIQDSIIIVDRDNSNAPSTLLSCVEPRGFGFVTFTECAGVSRVLESSTHKICDKTVSVP